MKKSEKVLLIAAVCTAVSALLYIYVIEPSVVSRKSLDICKADFVPDSRSEERSVLSVREGRATQKPGESGFALREGSSSGDFRQTPSRHTAEGMPSPSFGENRLKSDPSNVKGFARHYTRAGQLFAAASSGLRDKKYMDIYNRRDKLRLDAKKVFSGDYWKETPQEQLMAFQMYVEKLSRESGIVKISSIIPVQTQKLDAEDMAIQMEAECSLGAAVKFLFNAGESNIPLQVRKVQISAETSGANNVWIQIELATLWMR